jgi:DNA polymerase II small subunit/DNA polymerase delta subunit B
MSGHKCKNLRNKSHTLHLQTYINFYIYFQDRLSDLGEILKKRSERNAIRHEFREKWAGKTICFLTGIRNITFAHTVKAYDI